MFAYKPKLLGRQITIDAVNDDKMRQLRYSMRIPKRDVTHIVLSVYLLTLIHRYALNRKESY